MPAPSDSLEAETQDSTEEIHHECERIIDYDDDVSILDDIVLGRRAELEPLKTSSQTRTLPVTTSTSTSRQNRPPTQLTSAVDYDSIPEPFTKRKALGQSSSSSAASSSSNTRSTTFTLNSTNVHFVSYVSAPTKSTATGKQPAALSTIAEDEDNDMDEPDGNGDSNTSVTSIVDRNQAAGSHASRFKRDYDASGNEDFGYNGDDNDAVGWIYVAEPEQDPIPEPPSQKRTAKPVGTAPRTCWTIGRRYDDEPPQEEEEEPEPVKTPRGKRARLAREKKEKAKAKAKQKPEPLRKKDPNAPLKKTKRNFEPHGPQNLIVTTRPGFVEDSDTLPLNGGEEGKLSFGVHEPAKL